MGPFFQKIKEIKEPLYKHQKKESTKQRIVGRAVRFNSQEIYLCLCLKFAERLCAKTDDI
jgi:hypothetical protein